MKLIVGRSPGEVKIITDSGVDITQDLGVTEISVFVDPDGSHVQLNCEWWEFQGEFDYDSVAATVRVKGDSKGS